METFAERLVRMRKRAGYTQEDFAILVGVSIDTIRRWEGNKQEPRLGELKNISKVLETPIEQLVDDEIMNTPVEIVQEKNSKPHAHKSSKKGTIVIQQGNIRLEIPATAQGYAILREKLREVSINQDAPMMSIES